MNTAARPQVIAVLAMLAAVVVVGCSRTTAGTANSPTPSASAAVTASSSPPTSISEPTTPRTMQSPTAESTTQPTPTSSEPSSPEPAPTGSGVLPTDLTGVVYGFITRVDVFASQLTVDKVDWFTGAAAEQACAQDGVPPAARLNEWCSMYYFRNVNPTLRVVTVSPHVAVTTLDGNVQVAGDLAALADRITTPTGSSRPYRLTVTDGVVTAVTEMYQP